MIIFEDFLDLKEMLDEAMQALDGAVAHLLPPPPDQQQTPYCPSASPSASRPCTSHSPRVVI